MQVKELIKVLESYPQDYNIMIDSDDANLWVVGTECHKTGTSGYEQNGCVILQVSE